MAISLFDVPERIFGVPDTNQDGSPGPLSDLAVSNTLVPTERCSDMIGQRQITLLDLGENILCGDPRFVDPAGDYRLLPDSPAIGAGRHGLDLGAFVPGGATMSQWPELTSKDFANFEVDGPGIVEYRYRLDGAAWSDPLTIDVPIELAALPEGAHQLEVIGQNFAGRLAG